MVLEFLFFALLAVAARCSGYRFLVRANRMECLFEYVSEMDVEINGFFDASKLSDSVDFSFKISNPKGTILYESTLSKDEFFIKTNAIGIYRFCFSNRNYTAQELGLTDKKESSELVAETMETEEEEINKMNQKAKAAASNTGIALTPIDIKVTTNFSVLNPLKIISSDRVSKELDILSDMLIDIQSEQRYSRLRGYRINMFAEKAISSILWLFISELIIVAIFITAQLLYVTNIHKIKNKAMLRKLNKQSKGSNTGYNNSFYGNTNNYGSMPNNGYVSF